MTKRATQAAVEAAKPQGMRIIALQVENIKRVKFARIRPVGDVIEVVGENGSGKSSVLDAIDYALTGTGNIPSQPIRKGAASGLIQLQIGGDQVEFQIERTFTKINGGKTDHLTRLVVLGKNRERFPTPQQLLDGLMGAISFDPLEFTRMDSKEQFATLRKLVTVDLDAIEAEKNGAYDRRREAGRDVEAVKARLARMKEPSAELPAERVDTDGLTAKLGQAAEHNGAIERARQKQLRLGEDAKAHLTRSDAISQEIATLREKISQLERDRELAQENAKQLIFEIERIEVGEPIDTAATMEELQKAIATNGDILDRDQYRSTQAELVEAEARWTTNDEMVKAKEKERADAIAETKLPIDELTIGDGEVLYGGLPFDQASNAEQIRVSVALAIACNPKLRVLRIKDGSLLDKTSLAAIRAMAKSSDYQVWMERVEGDAPASIVMEAGEATGPQTEANPKEAK